MNTVMKRIIIALGAVVVVLSGCVFFEHCWTYDQERYSVQFFIDDELQDEYLLNPCSVVSAEPIIWRDTITLDVTIRHTSGYENTRWYRPLK